MAEKQSENETQSLTGMFLLNGYALMIADQVLFLHWSSTDKCKAGHVEEPGQITVATSTHITHVKGSG